MMYAKLFTSIYQGTLRGNSHGLLVFTNLLAHADQHGFVDGHPRAIAEEVGIDVANVRAALLYLEAPDSESRSPENEGRRIVRLDEHRDWGWNIVNYGKYRAIRNEDDRREQNRIAQKKWRESKQNRNQSKPRKPPSAHAEADTEADTKAVIPNTAPDGVNFSVWQDFQKLRKTLKAPITGTVMAGIQREADKAGVSLETALITCCERGWRGFKADWMASRPGVNGTGETAYQKKTRERISELTGGILGKPERGVIDVVAVTRN